MAVIARNMVVGIGSLGTGFTAVIGFGLLALGLRVGAGVATGELDPGRENISGNVE